MKVKLNATDFGYINKSVADFEIVQFDSLAFWNTSTPLIGFDFNRAKNPLRIEPKENSEIINHLLDKKYELWNGHSTQIKGEWLTIITITGEKGWVRWRRGEKVLIRMSWSC